MSKKVVIDKSKPVMVTGASGYVAGWLVKKLLDEGIHVHATVRDPENTSKIQHLISCAENSSGSITLFKADLLHKEGYEKAMMGCELVYHTASPFILDIKDPVRDVIEPAVTGTSNVLEVANSISSVKRIVVTSSCAAIYSDASDCSLAPNGILTEAIWNTTASESYQPYSYSKTLAEQKAWELQSLQSNWDLITINPSLVIGPPMNAGASNSESLRLLAQFGDGTLKMGAPKAGIGVVDVRDLANAHFAAGFTPEASGRYITSAHNTNFLELGLALQSKYGNKYPLPKKALPKWLLLIVGPFVNKNLTREYIRKNVNVPFNADNSKVKRELHIQFRPLQESMEDTFQSLIDCGLIKKRG